MTEFSGGRWHAQRLLIGLVCGWMSVAQAAEGEHVCVPGPDGRWLCGDASAPPEAAPIPTPAAGSRPTPVPPVLLMDPARFRVDAPAQRGSPPPRAPVATAEAAPAPAPITVPPPPPVAPPALSATPPRPSPSTAVPAQVTASASGRLRALAEVGRSGYTLQLAAAQSPDGFLPHLRRLGVAPEQAFALPIQRGGQRLWLLCLGEAADVAGARAFTPAGAPDAFVKPLATLFAEWTGEG